MSDNTAIVLAYSLRLIWCAAVFGTTAYAVFWLGCNGWWFALAAFVAAMPGAISRGGSDA